MRFIKALLLNSSTEIATKSGEMYVCVCIFYKKCVHSSALGQHGQLVIL